jgi:hypothetical protein
MNDKLANLIFIRNWLKCIKHRAKTRETRLDIQILIEKVNDVIEAEKTLKEGV